MAENPKGHQVVIYETCIHNVLFLKKASQNSLFARLAAVAHSHACGNKVVK
jgi:hypothetical protein